MKSGTAFSLCVRFTTMGEGTTGEGSRTRLVALTPPPRHDRLDRALSFAPPVTPKIILFLPVYNEEAQVGPLLDRTHRVVGAGTVQEVIAVDDGSTDQSAAILRRYPFCRVITHPERRGVGDALRSGYRYALDRGFDIFVVMAGNGKDDPGEIERLLAPILSDEADYVQGSRYLDGGFAQGLPAHRDVAIRTVSKAFSICLMRRYTDCTNGFRAYRTSLLRDERIDWNQAWIGPAYELEYYIHYRVAALGYRVKEVPVSKIYRPASDGSYSKIRGRDWIKMLRPLFYLRMGIRK